MSFYKPPYELTDTIVNLVAQISGQLGELRASRDELAVPRLRRQDIVQAVYSSLAIEGNPLTLEQVDSLFGTGEVSTNQAEREVQNATTLYQQAAGYDPYSQADLRRAHGQMMAGIAADAGAYRDHGEGVYRGSELVFMAPPPELVAGHMDNLFAWLQAGRSSINPLVASSVFHYEFVFVHPFSDGNGRLVRFWQSLLLCRWQPYFAALPVESLIRQHQNEYYAVINQCNQSGSATGFVELMLRLIQLGIAEKQDRQQIGVERKNKG